MRKINKVKNWFIFGVAAPEKCSVLKGLVAFPVKAEDVFQWGEDLILFGHGQSVADGIGLSQHDKNRCFSAAHTKHLLSAAADGRPGGYPSAVRLFYCSTLF